MRLNELLVVIPHGGLVVPAESPLDRGRKVFSPDIHVEIYAAELQQRLPDVKVTVNASQYHDVYGHVCGAHLPDVAEQQRVPGPLARPRSHTGRRLEHFGMVLLGRPPVGKIMEHMD